jgi:hypothetical protein
MAVAQHPEAFVTGRRWWHHHRPLNPSGCHLCSGMSHSPAHSSSTAAAGTTGAGPGPGDNHGPSTLVGFRTPLTVVRQTTGSSQAGCRQPCNQRAATTSTLATRPCSCTWSQCVFLCSQQRPSLAPSSGLPQHAAAAGCSHNPFLSALLVRWSSPLHPFHLCTCPHSHPFPPLHTPAQPPPRTRARFTASAYQRVLLLPLLPTDPRCLIPGRQQQQYLFAGGCVSRRAVHHRGEPLALHRDTPGSAWYPP